MCVCVCARMLCMFVQLYMLSQCVCVCVPYLIVEIHHSTHERVLEDIRYVISNLRKPSKCVCVGMGVHHSWCHTVVVFCRRVVGEILETTPAHPLSPVQQVRSQAPHQSGIHPTPLQDSLTHTFTPLFQLPFHERGIKGGGRVQYTIQHSLTQLYMG